ncbi:MAG: 4a-hydroxytetrahydrobiopterin dehydratase [Actinomycetota bacterium]
MKYTPVSHDEARAMASLQAWSVEEAALVREFRVGNFAASAQFISANVAASERLNHHPDIDIRYPDRVTVRLTTHAIRGLSTHDVQLAEEISGFAG